MSSTKQQLQYHVKQHMELRSALVNLVFDRIKWLGPKMASSIGGMPPKMLDIGITTHASEPFAILKDVDNLAVCILTPDELAQRPWPFIRAYPGLEEWMRQYGAGDPAYIEPGSPRDSWIVDENRKER